MHRKISYVKRIFLLFVCSFLCFIAIAQISVHHSGKYLVEKKTRKPFFWLGDTGWELFHRLTREEIVYYLEKRKAQGFNVIQAVALAEEDGLKTPNRYGDLPFTNLNSLNWNLTRGDKPRNAAQYDYWDHVDFAIHEAAKRNLYIGLLPTWGDKVAHLWGVGPVIFDEAKAYQYAKKLAERYHNQWNILWILGGDRPGTYLKNGIWYNDKAVWRAMAKGITDVWGTSAFITYHPGGTDSSSSAWFQHDSWLKMNAIQSGHGSRSFPVWDYIAKDLSFRPLKPTMDMEPCYEDHPVNPWDGKWTRKERGFFSDHDVRARIYRGVFAGGCGVTYGHHSVWQFLNTALYKPVNPGDTIIHWKHALDSKAGWQMQYLKRLMLSLPDPDRAEDSLLVVSERGRDYTDLIITTKSVKGAYALIYLPQSKPITVDPNRLKKGKIQARWYDPCTGHYFVAAGKMINKNIKFFPPGGNEKDWVLTLDVMAKKR